MINAFSFASSRIMRYLITRSLAGLISASVGLHKMREGRWLFGIRKGSGWRARKKGVLWVKEKEKESDSGTWTHWVYGSRSSGVRVR